jgi:hypothetical protein
MNRQADIKRNLGAFDPYLREMHFIFECVAENLLLASATNDYKASLTLEPGKLGRSPAKREPVLIGRVELSASETVASKRYDAIPHRHTNWMPCY